MFDKGSHLCPWMDGMQKMQEHIFCAFTLRLALASYFCPESSQIE